MGGEWRSRSDATVFGKHILKVGADWMRVDHWTCNFDLIAGLT
jgi:hypothetical protein